MKLHEKWHTREELSAQVVLLAVQGMSCRAIGRALGVHRKTAGKILERHMKQRDERPEDEEAPMALEPPPPRAPRETKLDDFEPRIHELLAQFEDITAQRVFEILADEGFDGSYTLVKERVRTLRPRPAVTASQPATQYGPAQMAENDWSPFEIAFTHAPKQKVEVFSYTLTHSTRKHYLLYQSTDLHALMDGHVASFDHFGGAAHACKYDGQKAVVAGWDGSKPIYNPRFLAFAAHYEFQPVACRRRKPNDKPRVERSFDELERSFLNGRSFRDLADMRAQLVDWERRIADLRPRRQAPKTPRMELFAEEQPLLRPLPCRPYDTARVVYRLCSIDGFVSWDGNRYAVPYEHVTDLLPVRITQTELLVYAPDLRCVARHGLAHRSLGATVGAESYHPRPAPDGRAVADLDQLRQTYDDLGDHARVWLDAMCLAQGRTANYQARRTLLLREHYSADDLCAALEHASQYGAYDHKAIERILNARFSPRRLEEYVHEDLTGRLTAHIEGQSRRKLSDYDRLPAQDPKNGKTKETPCPEGSHPPVTTNTSSDSGEPSPSSD